MMTILEEYANKGSVVRCYYGDNESEKPNDFCYWADFHYMPGWYETDEHLRNRIMLRINKES